MRNEAAQDTNFWDAKMKSVICLTLQENSAVELLKELF
jgi:hypothetical protein